jgi:hypothetical protein
MKFDQAIEIAQDALIWLSREPEAFGHFLNATGFSPDDLRDRHADPEFLGFLLDFVMMSDESVMGAAAAAGIAPDGIARARAALPGGDSPAWT